MSIPLQHRFADALPELATPTTARSFSEPRLVVLNDPLAAELGIDVEWLRSDEGLRFMVGQALGDEARPVAQLYAGHQFGGYVPRLGDGRAMLLGEVETPLGLRDIALKGSGPTVYARGGDGFAALGPMLREYLVSEAIHALGIPTTRSLAVVATGDQVLREEGPLPGAVLVRVASSHLRVGTFQAVRAADDRELLDRLVRHALERHAPEGADAEVSALALFDHVVRAQARLVAQWLGVGFVHGVMNTDNVTISGETIDYGPCAFLDAYSPGAVFSSIDTGGRYAFGRQPTVTQWNLARFAEALLPAIADDETEAVEAATAVLDTFPTHFNEAWIGGMAAKLGVAPDADGIVELVTDLHGQLEASAADFTTFFRDLATAARGDREPVRSVSMDLERTDAWLERWLALSPDPEAMDRVNPVHVPRNHLVEEALAAAGAGEMAPFDALVEAVRRPYEPIEGGERFAQPATAEFAASFQTFCGT
ncbi:YdiU family protein [Nocardioides sp. Y6]|uniref:Protein nucleotidyltransferase YdiU n=1 Tax=Nocardioides malaquae TaxID=2773426 RepID=A0ABR9RVM2_9ACTN|nr:YdiU family protein [Nocardioides malaquae]MBE7325657.1 YdiU family protein [Nocardioides malaquae]